MARALNMGSNRVSYTAYKSFFYFSLYVFIYSFSAPCLALDFEQKLKFTGYPENAYVVFFSKEDSPQIRTASLYNNRRSSIVRANIPVKGEVYAVGVIETVQGEIVSGSTKAAQTDFLGFFDSTKSLEAFYKNQLEALTKNIEKLEGEMKLATFNKRREAGLSDVDKVLDKAEALENSIQALKAAMVDIAALSKQME